VTGDRAPPCRACFVALASMLHLTACVTLSGDEPYEPPPVTRYTVLHGDTLYGIAFRLGLDPRDLARWNKLSNPDLIYPGQVLRLTAPAPTGDGDGARTAASKASASRSPAPTKVRQQGEKSRSSGASRSSSAAEDRADPEPSRATAGSARWQWPGDGALVARFGDPASVGRGIDIGGREGDSVVAAASGRVVYSGSGLIGYGNLVIIKHDDTYLSAYGHNRRLLVTQGQDVRAGQRIGQMGLGPKRRPLLHFEIRKNGDPVDPLEYLPAR
jgi:lipoprotein NlpD